MQLATDRLILREFVEDDWRAVHAIESIPEVVRYLPFGVRSEADAREYVDKIIGHAGELPRTVFDFAITERGANTLIGRCGLRRKESELRIAYLWFVVDPSRAGKGYATEAATAMLAYAFDELKLHRVYGECDPRNPSSARVMEKLGMRREAEHLEDIWIKDEWCGTWVFAMLEHEWAAR
ncbi:MAG: GNAT family N-acetyltransferase [Deltaproteobacteria bacterium]|nr:GNAT family N-acetyltransferase [Deltaproteobacteria bacterium]